MTELLSVEGLSHQFGGGQRVQALRDVSFGVGDGEIVALVGESGSGKSTVARVIARLLRPTAGRLVFEGESLLDSAPRPTLAFRRSVQMVFQDPFASLNPVHRVRHHLSRPLLRHRRAAREQLTQRIEELLDSVGLAPARDFIDKFPHELSGGQRQRVAIARALSVQPKLIVADEPTSMLDVSVRAGILNLMRRLKRESGVSFLYITHDLASARYLADRILVLYAGQLMEAADSDTLVNAPAHPYTRLLLSAAPDHSRPRQKLAVALKRPEPAGTAGCPFAPRCPEALPHCKRRSAPMQRVTAAQSARCHLLTTTSGDVSSSATAP